MRVLRFILKLNLIAFNNHFLLLLFLIKSYSSIQSNCINLSNNLTPIITGLYYSKLYSISFGIATFIHPFKNFMIEFIQVVDIFIPKLQLNYVSLTIALKFFIIILSDLIINHSVYLITVFVTPTDSSIFLNNYFPIAIKLIADFYSTVHNLNLDMHLLFILAFLFLFQAT